MKRLLVLLILVAGAYVLHRRYSIEVEYVRPFPLATGNGRYQDLYTRWDQIERRVGG